MVLDLGVIKGSDKKNPQKHQKIVKYAENAMFQSRWF